MNIQRIFHWNFVIIKCIIIWFTGCSQVQAQTVPADVHHNYVVAVSPYLDEKAGKEIELFLFRFILEKMPVGSSMTFLNGFTLEEIAQIDIPDHIGYAKMKPRMNILKSSLLKARAFFQNADPDPDTLYRINVPRICNYLAVMESKTKDESSCLLILGGALYDIDSSYSMTEATYPSDSHLYTEAGSSPYSTQNLVDHLKGYDTHWFHLSESGDNHTHSVRVTRFWELYFQRTGADLHTYTQYLNTQALEYLVRNDLVYKPTHTLSPDVDDKLIMYYITDTPSELDTVTVTDDYPAKLAGSITIGLEWENESTDLDLYCKPRSGSEELYFNNTQTDFGKYFKDVRYTTLNGVEYVNFSRDYHVNDIEISVNLYRNLQPRKDEKLNFKILLVLDGKKYEKQFSFDLGLSGNKGLGQDARIQPYWITLTASDLLPDLSRS